MRKLGGFVGAVAIVLLWAHPAAAGPTATLSSDHVDQNGTLQVSASGFQPNSAVVVTDGSSGSTITQASADSSGAVSNVSFQAGLAGIHRVRLVGIDPSGNAYLPVAVYSALCPQGANCALARTGGRDMTGLTLLGGGFLAVGWLIVGRRRVAATFGTQPLFASGLALLLVGAGLLAGPAMAQTTGGPGSITGKITNSSGGGGIGSICVHAASTSHNFGAGTTATDGTYTISNLPAGTYNVSAADCSSPASFITKFVGSVSVTTGNATPANAAMDQGGTLFGRMVAGTSGVGGCIWTGATADAMNCVNQAAFATGAFGTDPIAPAQLILAFAPFDNTHAFTYYNGKNDASGATALAVTAGSATNAGMTIATGGDITGTITDANGGAITRDVCIYDRSSDIRTLVSGFVTANGPGMYRLPNLGAGNHKVEFADCATNAPVYTTQFFSNKPNVSTADNVAVASGATQSGKDAAMAGGTGGGSTSSTSSTTSSTSLTTSSTAASSTSSTAASGSSTTVSTTAPATTGAAVVSTPIAVPGGVVTVSGDGFLPNSPVQVVVFSSPQLLAIVNADGAGHIVAQVTLPSNLAAGAHTLQLQGANPDGTGRVLSVPITITSNNALGVTGAPVSTATALGIICIAFGLVLVYLSRRRYRIAPGLHGSY